MIHVVPDYYARFRCIAGACRHSCCIGWEIDVDEDKLHIYDTLTGPFGDRLRAGISREGTPHFILRDGERCPFLNGDNLCDIILTLGEDHICQICAEHPRFHNHLPDRVESGLGLCCEEAGRLILGQKEAVHLVFDEKTEAPSPLLRLRDETIALLQDRGRPLEDRLESVLTLCGADLPERSWQEWCSFLLGLERLDEAWTSLLELLASEGDNADLAGFDLHMAARQTEYEQFGVYLLYRHLSRSFGEVDLAARAAFAVWGVRFLHLLGAVLWTKNGSFSFEDQVELARLFSSELEYSEENMDLLLDELC